LTVARVLQLRKPLLGLAGLAVAAQAAEALAGSRQPVALFGSIAVLAAALAALLGALLPSVHRRQRLVMAAGIGLYSLGQLEAFLLDMSPTSFPSQPGVLWLSLYPLVIAATSVVLRELQPRMHLAMWLDALVVGLVGAAAAFELLIEPLIHDTGARSVVVGQGIYPLLDVALVCFLLPLVLGTGNPGRAMLSVGGGFLLLLATDLANVHITANGAYRPGTLLDCGWPAALILLAGGLQSQTTLARATAVHGRRHEWFVGIALLASGVLFFREVARGNADVIGLGLLAAVPICALLRSRIALRENELLVEDKRQLIDAVGTGVIRADTDGIISYVNDVAAAALGWKAAELVGLPAHDTTHHSHSSGMPYDPHHCPIQEAFRGGRTTRRHGEVFWRRDGTAIPVVYTCSPVREKGVIRGVVVVFDDLAGELRTDARIRHHADHDRLTGLPNRAHFSRLLADALETSADDGRPAALAIFDLDALQFVNDSHGHATGDAVICQVAALLRREVPDSDLVGHLGADEFAVLLSGPGPEEAEQTLNKLLDAIRAGTAPRTDASCGVAALATGGGVTDADLLVAADVALLEAKQQGGGRVVSYRGERGAALSSIEELRQALAEDRFVLYAQPIVDARTGRKAYEELLVRMIAHDGTIVAPGAFLPTAERFGLINQLDRLIVAKALRAVSGGRRVAVNLSARTIGDRAVLEMIREAAAHSCLPTGSLSIEITETSVTTDMDAAQAFVTDLRLLGCSIALDDFGTGFGSFTCMRRLPVDTIKIDMEFIRELTRRGPDYHLVKALVTMARSLGQSTVAEGVEDAETLEILRELGIHYAQGYFVGRPAPLLSGYERRAA
jgi:diguanylate cyclase (GGDEF)-like protein/PAS domain S-box-containing protein